MDKVTLHTAHYRTAEGARDKILTAIKLSKMSQLK
jgi:hypothetical protein